MMLRSLTARLFVALLTSASMLHLTLVGSRPVCTSDVAKSAHVGMTMSGTIPPAGDEASPSRATHAADQQPTATQSNGDHRAPTPERCCESMSSCGVTTVASAVERAISSVAASATPAYSVELLASVRTAPEPPPPKA